MKLVNIKLIVLFLVSYVLALVFFAPLRWIVPFVEPKLVSSGISVSNVEGTIWRGTSDVRKKGYGFLSASWQIHPLSIFVLKLPADVQLQNSDLQISGRVVVSPSGISVKELSGYLDEKVFAPIYLAYKSQISGRLTLTNISADAGWSKKLGAASGSLAWSGGPITVPVGRSMQNYEVPMMKGEISSNEEGWALNVLSSDKQEFIEARLSAEGVGMLSIKRQLATQMNLPVPAGGQSMFDISQQVF